MFTLGSILFGIGTLIIIPINIALPRRHPWRKPWLGYSALALLVAGIILMLVSG